MAKITKKQVESLGQAYHDSVMRWGERNMQSERAFIRYMEAKKQYEKQKSK